MKYKRISKITGVPKDELKKRYQAWSKGLRKKKNPDLKLIAAFSGLSISTVSGHINGKKGALSRIKAEMLDELLTLLEYRRSSAAHKLRSSSKMSIGFVAPISNSPSTEYSVEILKGVKSEALKYGFSVDIYDIGPEEGADFISRLPFLGLVDGLIVVLSSFSSNDFRMLIRENVPVFQINPLKEQHTIPFVGVLNSDTDPFRELLSHLFEDHGFRNPVLIYIPVKSHVQRQTKMDLYEEALTRHGIGFDTEHNFLSIASYSYQEGRSAWKKLKKINPDADVIICLSDIIAASFIQEIRKENKNIPVTGYGNFEIGKLLELTTVDQHIRRLGSDAFEQLFYAVQFIRRQEDFPEYRTIIGPSEFVKRESCACYAGQKHLIEEKVNETI